MKKESKLENYTKEELIDKLSRLYDKPHIAETIYGLIDKIDEVNLLFRTTTIDITSDIDKTFQNLIVWGSQCVKMNANINELLESLDPEERAEIALRQAQAKDTSLEALMKAARKKKNG